MKVPCNGVSLNQELVGVYRQHGEAWGGIAVILRSALDAIIGCADRVIRLKSEYGQRVQGFQDDSPYKAHRRSDVAHNLARAVCALEQAAVFLGSNVCVEASGAEPAASIEAAADAAVAKLVRTAMDVSAHLNLRENCHREGLEEPSGRRLGADCLTVAGELAHFVDVLAATYPADVEDYESSRRRILDIVRTNRPETKYQLREPVVDAPEPLKAKDGQTLQ